MASELTTSAPQVTGTTTATNVRAWARKVAPFRAVVLPWLVARVLALIGLMAPHRPTNMRIGRLIFLDGQWYRFIALDWYDRPYVAGRYTEYPFFPLLPSIGGALMHVGVPSTVALAGVSWMGALAALAGILRLATRHLSERAAPWATWFVAIAPGALTMVLGYADSLYLAGLVWGLVLAEDRRWWAAGGVAAIATAARPNGWIAPVAVVVTALVARARRRHVLAAAAPSVIFLIGWCGYLWWATGDPLVFLSAKRAWNEVTFCSLVTSPFTGRHGPALFHLLWCLVLVVPYLMRARRQPISWAFVVGLTVLPPLVLGIEGLARYAIFAFPMPLAAADVLTSSRRWPALVALTASGVGLTVLAFLMIRRTWLP
jgi:hypothetical protein